MIGMNLVVSAATITVLAMIPQAAMASTTGRDLTVSAESSVTKPHLTLPPHDQGDPAIAWNGDIYLVVWSDRRSFVDHDIYGARVTRDGRTLDPTGFPIARSVRNESSPAVASAGSGFYVAWEEAREDPFYGPVDIHGVPVRADGTVVASQQREVAGGAEREGHATVAGGNAGYLVAWEEHAQGGDVDVVGRRVTAAGDLTGTEFPIARAPQPQRAPAAAWGGDAFLVTWEDGRSVDGADIFGSIVAVGGSPGVSAPTRLSGEAGSHRLPAVTAGGGGFLVSWSEHASGAGHRHEVRVARVTSEGRVRDRPSILLGTTSFPEATQIAWDGTRFIVLWTETHEALHLAGVARDGKVGPVAEIAAPMEIGDAAMAGAGPLLAVWMRDDVPGTDLMRTVIDEQLTAARPSIPLVLAATEQRDAAIGWNGELYLVVWVETAHAPEHEDHRYDLYAARLGPDARMLDPEGIVVATDLFHRFPDPRVASDDDGFLVVWTDYRGWDTDIVASRIRADGTVEDPGGFELSAVPGHQWTPDVAWVDGFYLVAWTVGDRIATARISPEGVVRNRRVLFDLDDRTARPLRIAAGGTGAAVTWAVYEDGVSSVFAARLSSEGEPLDDRPIVLASRSAFTPAIAWDGSDFLVTWSRGDASGDGIHGTLLRPEGTVLEPGGREISAGASERPEVAWNGADFVVAYTGGGFIPSRQDVLAVRVRPSGAAVPGTLTVSETGAFEAVTDAVAGRRGTVAVVYGRAAPGLRYTGVQRVFVRFLERV